MLKESLLWIGKAPVNGLGAEGGDEIYDRKIIAALSSYYNVERMLINKVRGSLAFTNLLKGIPHPRYKYFSNDVLHRIKLIAQEYKNIVVSWESFDFIPDDINVPISLIVHNVISDMLVQVYPDNVLAKLAAQQSRRWERLRYSRKRVQLVALSERDAALVRQLAPDSEVIIAPPGVPIGSELAKFAVIPEGVISGSVDWLPKRRDLISLALDYETSPTSFKLRHDTEYSGKLPRLNLFSQSTLIKPSEFSDGLRVGIIPDTFISGFKLKSLFYVANNCTIASKANISSEFNSIPYADRFVKHITSLRDVETIMRELSSVPEDVLAREWGLFKDACLTRFTWEGSAANIRHGVAIV